MNATRLRGLLAATTAASLVALTVLAAPVSAARSTSKTILIGSSTGATTVNDPGPTATGAALLTFTPVSAGNLTFFDVVVKNAGGQTVNNIQLSAGFDSVLAAENVRPVTTALTPAFPAAFPAGNVTISSFNGAGCSAADASLGPINCTIGTLAKGQSFKLQVVLATTTAGTVPVKAVAKVSENTNDSGANQDTFAAEGALPIADYSCDASSAYLPGNSGNKTIATCPVGDTANGNRQGFSISFPARLTTVSIREDDADTQCPVVGGCFGAAFVADITGDGASDLVTWSITVDLAPLGKTNLNLNKLVVYHYDDAGALSPVGGIANTKKNECKSTTSGDCIVSASIDGTILTVVYRSNGNGKTRLLG